MGIRDQWLRFKSHFRRKPAIIGVPPSQRQVPAHPELHALDFAERYAEPLDYHAAQTMIDLGVPRDRIGASAPLHGIKHATFLWRERTGGGVSADGRITLDSGIFNEELLDKDHGEQTGRLWRKLRLRPRMEAITAHELAEAESGSHEEALKAAPTLLPMSHEARELLRAMDAGWKRR